MSRKPIIAFARPHQWASLGTGNRFSFVHIPLFGAHPVLRDGSPMHDSVGGVLEDGGKKEGWRIFAELRPEFFLFGAMYDRDGTRLQVDGVRRYLGELKDISPGTRFLYWNGNQQGEIDFNVSAFKEHIDAVLTNTRDPVEHQRFVTAGISRVGTLYQFGFDPLEHGREPSAGTERKLHDIFFAGSQTFYASPSKKRYPHSLLRFDLISEMHKRFDLEIRGKGTWPFPHSPHVTGQALYDAYCGSKIILGANHLDLRCYYTRRTVYALASGRMLLTLYIPGMEEDFQDRVHLVCFRDIEEALKLTQYYLDHDLERRTIAARGRELAVLRFSWSAIALALEQEIERLFW